MNLYQKIKIAIKSFKLGRELNSGVIQLDTVSRLKQKLAPMGLIIANKKVLDP